MCPDCDKFTNPSAYTLERIVLHYQIKNGGEREERECGQTVDCSLFFSRNSFHCYLLHGALFDDTTFKLQEDELTMSTSFYTSVSSGVFSGQDNVTLSSSVPPDWQSCTTISPRAIVWTTLLFVNTPNND